MTLFSQRKGIKPVKNVMQVDSMDSDLKNGLWNATTIYLWDNVETYYDSYLDLGDNRTIVYLIKRLWHSYFKKTLDTIPQKWSVTYQTIREYFFNCSWYEVYDFIEFITNNYGDASINKKFMDFCNSILEHELSAYRFVNGKITQITSEEEISEIEGALEATKPLKPVAHHLKRALDLLADRKSPDYRNSIKESISAVESICKKITNDEKTTLGQTLKKLEDKVNIHPALKKAFENIYGYTSNEDGIRHALLEESDLDFEDAKFMLVSCSAFINYLITKSSKAGVRI